jgi:hypothetical protein
MCEGEAKAFWHALQRSRWSRATTLRQQLALAGHMRMDLDFLFLQQITPQTVMATLDDLVAERHLSRAKASQLQERVLALVDRHGEWLREHMT